MVATSGWLWPEDFSRSSKACGDTDSVLTLLHSNVFLLHPNTLKQPDCDKPDSVGGLPGPCRDLLLVLLCLEPQPAASHLFAERNSNFISPLGGVLDDQVVERSQAGWNLVATLLCCSCCTAVMLLQH